MASLGALAEFRNGLNYSKSNWGNGLRVLGIPDFTGVIIPAWQELSQINPDGVVQADDMLRDGDIVFVRSNGNRDLIGRSILISAPPFPLSFSGFCIRLRFRSGSSIDSRFFAYLFRTDLIRKTLSAHGSGTNIVNLNQQILSRLSVPLPDLPTQRRIADILSAYDDLIENNRRRMALLEESVHLLYREWFVRLRFPGHERVKVVDGLPEGWRMATLSEVCPGKEGIQTGPFGSQLHAHEYSDVGVPVVNPQDMVGPRLSTAAIARVPEQVAQRLVRHRMQAGDIVYGRRGDIGRRAQIGVREAGWLCGTGSLRLRPEGALVRPLYLLHTLDSDVTRGAIRDRAKGATMPNLSAQLMQTVPVMLPPAPLQVDFERFAEGAEAMVANLLAANQKLAEARDLLLPRLMDGSLPV